MTTKVLKVMLCCSLLNGCLLSTPVYCDDTPAKGGKPALELGVLDVIGQNYGPFQFKLKSIEPAAGYRGELRVISIFAGDPQPGKYELSIVDLAKALSSFLDFAASKQIDFSTIKRIYLPPMSLKEVHDRIAKEPRAWKTNHPYSTLHRMIGSAYQEIGEALNQHQLRMAKIYTEEVDFQEVPDPDNSGKKIKIPALWTTEIYLEPEQVIQK